MGDVINVLGNRVAIKRTRSDTTTKSGIIVPLKEMETTDWQEVIAVGDTKLVKKGDQVIAKTFALTESGDTAICDEDTIVAVKRGEDIYIL